MHPAHETFRATFPLEDKLFLISQQEVATGRRVDVLPHFGHTWDQIRRQGTVLLDQAERLRPGGEWQNS